MMMSPMMQHLLPPVALLLLSVIPTETEVVTSMADCNEFFLEQTPPHIPGILEEGDIKNQNRYKPICQTLRNIRRFVTLYDINNKIPVFSAAKYNGGDKGPRSQWKIEPQLENIDADANMTRPNKNIIYKNQAVYTDYQNDEGFTKGHLFPSAYTCGEAEKRSTFTLTNAVPQVSIFNGKWNHMENCVKCILDNYCISNNIIEGFVVIGAEPGNGKLKEKEINIPSMLWSAFCCYNDAQKTWLAGAHWGENNESSPTQLPTHTLAELEGKLGIKAFPGTQCPNEGSVIPLYSEPDCKDHCRHQQSRKKSLV